MELFLQGTLVSVSIFVITIIMSLLAFSRKNIMYHLIFSPYECWHYKRWYKILTSGVIHADLSHLIFNLFTFYFFAFDLERNVGSYIFFIIYFVSLVVSHLPTLFKYKNDTNYRSLGASGAISGVLFSAILLFPESSLMFFIIPIPIPAPIFGITYLIYCQIAKRYAQDRINHSAHFAGAVGGILATFILLYSEIIMIWMEYLEAIF